MTFTALAVVFLLVCAFLGLGRGRRGSEVVLAGSLAFAMVCAQLVLLLRT